MTSLPVCDFDGHFWPRSKRTFYVALPQLGDGLRYRLRFCPTHCSEVHEYLAEHEAIVTELALGISNRYVPKCLAGGEPVLEQGTQVFITGYPAKDQREDYWAKLCSDHEMPTFLREPNAAT